VFWTIPGKKEVTLEGRNRRERGGITRKKTKKQVGGQKDDAIGERSGEEKKGKGKKRVGGRKISKKVKKRRERMKKVNCGIRQSG